MRRSDPARAVSAADPVDRETGRLVELPDAPFLVGALDAPAVLAELVEGPVTVDNDVNWMARAEHEGRDFVYVFLGEGVGAAVVSDGRSGAATQAWPARSRICRPSVPDGWRCG